MRANGGSKNRAECAGKRAALRTRELLCRELWVNPGQPEGFIRVDVADARKDRLVQQRNFHNLPPSFQARAERRSVTCETKHIWPKLRQLRMPKKISRTHQFHLAELPDVRVLQPRAIQEVECQPDVAVHGIRH
jgi:hypothetical protein